MESVSATAKSEAGAFVLGETERKRGELAHTIVMNKLNTETKKEFLIPFTELIFRV